MTPLTLKDLLKGAEDVLGIEQIAGRAGLMRIIDHVGMQDMTGRKNSGIDCFPMLS